MDTAGLLEIRLAGAFELPFIPGPSLGGKKPESIKMGAADILGFDKPRDLVRAILKGNSVCRISGAR